MARRLNWTTDGNPLENKLIHGVDTMSGAEFSGHTVRRPQTDLNGRFGTDRLIETPDGREILVEVRRNLRNGRKSAQ